MTDTIEPLDGEALVELADSLAAQSAAYARHADVRLLDLGAAMCLAAAMLMRANLSAADAAEQWRQLTNQVTDILKDSDHARLN
jgi:PIN domain nuclease of toxin-antitoxin system